MNHTPAQRHREHPWHERTAGAKHYQWFSRLVSLHELTQGWLRELQVERPGHLITRGLKPQVSQNLWMLDFLSRPGSKAGPSMDSLLDDTSPEDILGRLEHTVWSVQAWTLMSCVERAPADTRQALESILEQSSWKLGRKHGEAAWPSLPEHARQDLRALLLALSPHLVSGTGGDEFLLKRAVQSEVQIELKSCPHRSRYLETAPIADLLCRLHAQWMRGFVYALNSKVTVEHMIGKAPHRCLQRWFFLA